jgi:hypothetical protein
MNNFSRKTESGNVMFYILIAVALLAALSFAVSQSGRGSTQSANTERARMLGDEIIGYGNVLANATTQLKLRGCKDTELSFENTIISNANPSAPTDKTCNIFDVAGGGVAYQEFTSFSTTPGSVKIMTGTKAVEQAGLDDQSDLWMVVNSNDPSAGSTAKTICAHINKVMQVNTADDNATSAFEPIINGDWADTDFIGTYPTASALDLANLNGKNAFCAGHGTNEVTFYRLLLAR